MDPLRTRWLDRTQALPSSPGVYLFKDAGGVVIYVGKAKSLKPRVRSYFQEGSSDDRAFIRLLGPLLSDIETMITSSEKEALLLERELIRQHEPRFNVIWRDDKQYLMLRIETEHEWPRVQAVRNAKKDGARYFGPFHSASAARQTLRVVNRHFQLRTCRDTVLYNRKRPCIEYQIGRCPAPCCLPVSKKTYRESVDDVIMFLEGKGEALSQRLEDRMWRASEAQDFELAGHYRDQLKAVAKTLERQNIASTDLEDQDVFGLYREGEEVCLSVMEVRGGRIRNISSQLFENLSIGDGDVIESFALQRYGDGDGVPPRLLVGVELESRSALEEILSDRAVRRVSVAVPKRGHRASLVKMAQQNAEHAFHEQRLKSGAVERTLEALREGLDLERLPVNIECFDISNLGSDQIVGSQVVFERGSPAKRKYRKYTVKHGKGQDDFASMYEVLTRRFRRGLGEGKLPDLVVVDGGKGQLNVARAVFRDLGIEGVELVSLAKSRGTTDEGGSLTPERVFKPGESDPIVLRQTSAELLLLARIRDEAHRFAITFQREQRRRARLRSSLEDVPGIGPKRRKALLQHLGSFQRVRSASLQALMEVPGIDRASAQRVHRALHPGQYVVDDGAE